MEKTIECNLEDIDRELRTLVEGLLAPGEEIQICYRVEYHMVWAEVITSRQVIMAKGIALHATVFSFKPKIEMPVVASILLKDIDHFEIGKNKEYDLFSVNIYTRDGGVLETNFTLESAARKFHDILSSASGKQEHKPVQAPVSERLLVLSDLLEKNMITEEEYQQKRSEILKSI